MSINPVQVLGAGGMVDDEIGDRYEPRIEQIRMADAVHQALAAKRHLVVEAGTGTGKTFGYLVPAVIRATEEGDIRRVLVSTRTKILQNQIFERDLATLKRSMAPSVNFDFALLKGRGNYLSKRRNENAIKENGSMFDNDLEILRGWSEKSKTGDRSELETEVHNVAWLKSASDSDDCLKKECNHYDTCFFWNSRRLSSDHRIVVVNHSLLMAGLTKANILPDFDALIVDEAHELVDCAMESLSHRMTERGMANVVGSIDGIVRQFGIQDERVPHGRSTWNNLARAVRLDVEKLWTEIDRENDRQKENRANGRIGPKCTDILDIAVRVVDGLRVGSACLEDLCSGGLVLDLDQNTRQFIRAASNRLASQAEALDEARKGALEELSRPRVVWLEEYSKGVALKCSPVDVSEDLREIFFSENRPPVILTSATMTVSGKFDHFKKTIGLDDADELLVDSPFEYQSQVRIVVHRSAPDPRASDPEQYVHRIGSLVLHHVRETEGGVLVILTSIATMRRLRAYLSMPVDRMGRDLFCQGEGNYSPARLLEKFRASGNGILLGVDSFRQGIDIPGSALSTVILTKLPFPVPTTAINQARSALAKERGEDPFRTIWAPEMILASRQAFGRLIRTSTDQGTFVLLDPRVLSAGYGETLLRSLPKNADVVD